MDELVYEEYDQDDIEAQLESLKVAVSDGEIEFYEKLSGERAETESDTISLTDNEIDRQMTSKSSPSKDVSIINRSIECAAKSEPIPSNESDDVSNYMIASEILKIVTKFNQDFEHLDQVITRITEDFKDKINTIFIEQSESIDYLAYLN